MMTEELDEIVRLLKSIDNRLWWIEVIYIPFFLGAFFAYGFLCRNGKEK